MGTAGKFSDGNVLIHPSLLRRRSILGTPQELHFEIANFRQIEAAFGFDGAKAAVAALMSRAQRALAGGGIVSQESDCRIAALFWEDPSSFPDLSSDERRGWLAALVSDIMMAPVQSASGPYHLHIAVAESGFNRIASTAYPEHLFDAASDPAAAESVRRSYRADMALVSPVLAALGGFRVPSHPGPDADVCWRPVEYAGASGSSAYFEASLAVIDPGGRIESGESVIAAAQRLGMAALFDHHLVSRVVDELNEARGAAAMAVSVAAESLADTGFWREIAERIGSGGGVASDLIIEVRGTASGDMPHGMREALAEMRRVGCRLSIGAFGLGCTSLRDMIALAPEFVTIDKYFLSSANQASGGFDLLEHLVGLARAAGATVVLDGVDTAEMARVATRAGADLHKGEHCGGARFSRRWAGQASRSPVPVSGAVPVEPDPCAFPQILNRSDS